MTKQVKWLHGGISVAISESHWFSSGQTRSSLCTGRPRSYEWGCFPAIGVAGTELGIAEPWLANALWKVGRVQQASCEENSHRNLDSDRGLIGGRHPSTWLMVIHDTLSSDRAVTGIAVSRNGSSIFTTSQGVFACLKGGFSWVTKRPSVPSLSPSLYLPCHLHVKFWAISLWYDTWNFIVNLPKAIVANAFLLLLRFLEF